MPVSLTRTVEFSAHHRYFRPEWSEAENSRRFGACAEAPGHRHDYLCAVTVSGPVDHTTGMIMDLGDLDRILNEEVVGPFGGRHLNLDVPAFGYGRVIPTGEEVASYLFARISARLPAGVMLERVRVQEDPTLYSDCTGV